MHILALVIGAAIWGIGLFIAFSLASTEQTSGVAAVLAIGVQINFQ
jgi:hypothetical protein